MNPAVIVILVFVGLFIVMALWTVGIYNQSGLVA